MSELVHSLEWLGLVLVLGIVGGLAGAQLGSFISDWLERSR